MSNNRSIDKDELYKKIMPSATQKENKEHMKGVLEVQTQETENNSQELKPAKSYVNPKSIVNLAEYAVNQRRDEAMKKLKCCMCDRCQKDVTALAVNKLAPKYVVMYLDEIKQELEKYQGDVVTALVSAIMIVKNHPRH